jgi:hypothetical protein
MGRWRLLTPSTFCSRQLARAKLLKLNYFHTMVTANQTGKEALVDLFGMNTMSLCLGL